MKNCYYIQKKMNRSDSKNPNINNLKVSESPTNGSGKVQSTIDTPIHRHLPSSVFDAS